MGCLSGNFYSRSLLITTEVNVIVPDKSEDFWTEIDDEVRVLYLLHGLGSNADEWMRFSQIEAFSKIYNLAVIMPNGNRSFYHNLTTGPRYFDWITRELPSLIEQWFNFPRDREHTFIAGESMGGYGALQAAFARPDYFFACAALSPVTSPSELCKSQPDLWWGKEEQTTVFGQEGASQKDDVLFAAQKSVAEHGAKKMPKILQMVGSNDPLTPQAAQLDTKLKEMGLETSFDSWEGRHDFIFWNVAIEKAIRSFCGLPS
nr:alpha/beta hydrolase-fold protein [Olegusella massiliensis]